MQPLHVGTLRSGPDRANPDGVSRLSVGCRRYSLTCTIKPDMTSSMDNETSKMPMLMMLDTPQGRLSAYVGDEWIVFTGGRSGEHRIAVNSSAARIGAHWNGYVSANAQARP